MSEHDDGVSSCGEEREAGDNGTKLMESGSMRPDGSNCGECRINRGMAAISADGQEVGWVAAIEMDTTGRSTGVVVARPRTTLEYYHLPLGLISSVNDGQVRLRIRAEAARALPLRDAGSTACVG